MRYAFVEWETRVPHERGRTKVHKIKKSSLERGEERGEKMRMKYLKAKGL